MAKPIISPEDAAELQRLYKERIAAEQRSLDALHKHHDHQLSGEDLQHFLEAEEAVAVIARQIRRILGSDG